MARMQFADAHVHLSDFSDPSIEARLSASMGMVLSAVSTDRSTSVNTLEIAKKHGQTVRPFVGVHPSEVSKAEGLAWLSALLVAADGCGEIGLDPRYSDAGPGSLQARFFDAQLEAAERAGKVVQVHSRGAENACLQALSRYTFRGVLVHWFEGEDLAREVRDRGYYISLGPALLYSKKLQRMAVSFDRTLALTESDGPVAFGALGGVRGPPLVPSVVFKLAGLWKLSFEETAEMLFRNHARYLGQSGKG